MLTLLDIFFGISITPAVTFLFNWLILLKYFRLCRVSAGFSGGSLVYYDAF